MEYASDLVKSMQKFQDEVCEDKEAYEKLVALKARCNKCMDILTGEYTDLLASSIWAEVSFHGTTQDEIGREDLVSDRITFNFDKRDEILVPFDDECRRLMKEIIERVSEGTDKMIEDLVHKYDCITRALSPAETSNP